MPPVSRDKALCMYYMLEYTPQNAQLASSLFDEEHNESEDICYTTDPFMPVVAKKVRINGFPGALHRYTTALQQLQSSPARPLQYLLSTDQQIVDFINQVYVPNETDADPALYDAIETTTAAIKETLRPLLSHAMAKKTLNAFSSLVGKNHAKYLKAPMRRVQDVHIYDCHVLRQDLQRNVLQMISKKDAEYALHLSAMKKSGFTVIGYARKSSQPQCDDDKREELLDGMVQKLKSRSKVQKVYVSWSSKSSSSISSRDIDQQQRLGDGNTQTMIKFLKKTRQQVILVIRDFAGLTTDPEDLRAFLNQHRSITHIFVDEAPFSADVRMLSAAQILKDDEIANLFHCRSPCRPRSL